MDQMRVAAPDDRHCQSERQLRSVLDSMGEGFALLGPDFTILDVNCETLRLDGRSREELVGRRHWDAFPETENSQLGLMYQRVARERRPASLEHVYHWPDGRHMWIETRAYPAPNGGVAIFWRDITEQKAAADELRESEKRYRDLFESMDEAYAVVEVLKGPEGDWQDFRFLEVNPAFLRHTGMPYPVGKTATELLGTPNPRWTQLYGQALDTGEPLRLEETEYTLGRIFDLNIFSLDRERNRVAVLFTNITDRKQAEQALRESEARFRALAETAPALIWQNDANGENLFINQQFLSFTGRTAEEILGAGWHSIIHPDEAETYIADYLAAVREQRSWRAGARLRRFDGAWRTFENHAQPLFDANGNYAGHVGVSVDVTDVLESEQARREEQERSAFLLRFTDAVRGLSEPAQVAREACRLLTEQLGTDRTLFAAIDWQAREYVAEWGFRADGSEMETARWPLDESEPTTADHLAGRAVTYEDVRSDDRLSEKLKSVMGERGLMSGIVVPVRVADKLVAVLSTSQTTSPRRWSSGEIAFVQALAHRAWGEIERARAQSALQASEERFRALAQTIEDVFYMTDLDHEKLLYLSPSYTKVWGRPLREVEENLAAFDETIHPDDRAKVLAGKEKQARGEPVTVEYRIVRPDGEVRWILDRCFPVPYHHVRRSAGIASDITERKATEAALREGEQLREAMLEVIPLGLAMLDTQGQVILSNPQFEQFVPTKLLPAIDRERQWRWRAWNEDGTPLAPENFPGRRALRGERVDTAVEFLYTDDSGAELWTSVAAVPVHGLAGEVIGAVSIIQNIDAAKRAADGRRRSEERFRQFGEASSDLLWIRNADTLAFEYLSPAFEHLYGRSRDELSDDHVECWVAMLHPDDRAAARATLRDLQQGIPANHEFRVLLPDGSTRWMHNTDFPMTDERGRQSWIAGIAQDITVRRRAVEFQATLLAELQHRVRNTLALIRSLIGRTSRTKTNVDDFTHHLQGRIDAMARTQAMLTRSPGQGVDLEDMVRDELVAQVAPERTYWLRGPPVSLPAKVAEVLSLAVHELATNSVKYGALGSESGTIRVDWSCDTRDGQRWLRFAWDERGIHVDATHRDGFGTELLTRRVPYELGGSGEVHFDDDGLTATLQVPLQAKQSILQTDSGFTGDAQ